MSIWMHSTIAISNLSVIRHFPFACDFMQWHELLWMWNAFAMAWLATQFILNWTRFCFKWFIYYRKFPFHFIFLAFVAVLYTVKCREINDREVICLNIILEMKKKKKFAVHCAKRQRIIVLILENGSHLEKSKSINCAV